MKITVYTINDCAFSTQEKDYLVANKLAFEEKNLETNKDFLTEMLAVSNNFSGTPVTKIEKDDGQIVVLKGFTKDEFDKALGLTTTEPTIDIAPKVEETHADIQAPTTPPVVSSQANDSLPPLDIPTPATTPAPTPTSDPISDPTQTPTAPTESTPETPQTLPTPTVPETPVEPTPAMPETPIEPAMPTVPESPAIQPTEPTPPRPANPISSAPVAPSPGPSDDQLNSILSDLQNKVKEPVSTPPSTPTVPSPDLGKID